MKVTRSDYGAGGGASMSFNYESILVFGCRAAKDGLVEVLKEATRRDANAADEDGMTPTLWAAHEGRLEALRQLLVRGGEPNRCDHYGNTALHCAAARGHMHCVTFLVNFGVNLWAKDNDFHTPKDLAALNNKEEILRYLDAAEAEEEMKNRKEAKAKQAKAEKEAEKRVRDFDKIQKEAAKKAEKEEKKMKKEREKMQVQLEQGAAREMRRDSTTTFSDIVSVGSTRWKSKPGLGVMLQPKKIHADASASDFKVGAVEADGKRTIRSLTGLRRDSEVLLVPTFSNSNPVKRGKLSDVFRAGENPKDDVALQHPSSIFDRPGFGSVAFMATVSGLSGGRMNFPTRRVEDIIDEDEVDGSNAPWDEEDVESDEETFETSSIELFLEAAGLSEFIHNFAKEKIDLEALMLLEEVDLEKLGLPLGPRKKLHKAIRDRRDVIEEPGEIIDTHL
ncbi:unnamed protein product [Darwinula stevensoni]|uniref:SAM domain-containing protein n=1 Tax=Darwinula stevensoni TaxID=69355 RepID=A0A7R9A5X2_9CRUS|nr:unnamed protein product [Darwinula stevensoni]CAG0887423.1 unnamed protein product [Darwinula stevensoni]